MRNRKPKLLMLVALTVGSLFAQGVEGGCYNIGTQALMTSIQPCGIFNCSGSLFGGAVRLCGGASGNVVVGCP